MRLEKNFGLSTFPVFRVSRYFEVRNKFGIVTLVSNVRKFRETYRKFSRKSLPKINPENYTGIFVICRKCRKYTGIFEKLTVSAKNSGTFLTFLTYVFEISLIIDQIGPKKMVENPENYTGIFDFLPKMTDFRLSTDCRKCTELFGLLFSR